MENNISAVVLAAGQGKRMHSATPKVLMPICGMSMIDHVVKNIKDSGIENICIVIGNKGELIREHMGEDYSFAVQSEARGTADAVASAKDFISAVGGKILVMCADAPLQSSVAIKQFTDICVKLNLDLGVMSSVVADPANYGRIIRDDKKLIGIVEKKDATPEQAKINEINSGTYFFDSEKLIDVLNEIDCNNAQGEYYLTDAVELFCKKGYNASALVCEDPNIIKGANDLSELAECERIMRKKINTVLMLSGVKIIDPDNTYIDRTVTIGVGTTIWPNSFILGNTVIGADNEIIGGRITDCVIGSGNKIDSSVLESSTVRNNNTIGPMAHIRPHCEIKDNTRIGNFVEVKASVIDDGSKVSHLTYVGDGRIGKNVNLGCGVVFANYDGKKKHVSTIGDNAFIGCNTNIVSPVTIGEGALIGAGTTITKNVAEYTLVVGRARQETIRELDRPQTDEDGQENQ